MYLAILDDRGQELAMRRIVLFDVTFRMSPGRNPGEHCSIVNAEPIVSAPLQATKGWAAMLGLCEEVDSPPFTMIPMEHGHQMTFGQSLQVAPGQLVLTWFDIKRFKETPDPKPVPPRVRSKV